MHDFAFVFRATTAVAAADLPKRNAAARQWALDRKAEGKLRYAAPLEDGGWRVGKQGVEAISSDHGVAAFLVLAASDREDAVALAKTHPGLAYGTEIEVRPVKAIGPAQ